MKIAVVGVTGLVGTEMLKVLKETNFPVTELIPVASEKSKGKQIEYNGKTYSVVTLAEGIAAKPVIALFSAGGDISKEWAPKYSEAGITVVDNSSAWRMDANKKLIIPEINANILTTNDKIIANPNCSTIQMLATIAPLNDKYKIKRLVISTYQSITGTGVKAVKQLDDERNGIEATKAYPHRIDKNCIPQCDVFTDNGYTKEEMKLVNETHKILNNYTIGVTATAVRVPVVGGHSEAVNIEFENEYEINDVFNILRNTKGIIVEDDIANSVYPMPINSKDKNEVFVGRIRRDYSNPKTLNMWIVADNLRKGAATNTIQIAQYLVDNKLV